MIFLVEKMVNGQTTLGTDNRHIFRQYGSLQSLERYQIKRLLPSYGAIKVSIFYGNIYGTPRFVYKYEYSQTNPKGFWRCALEMWKIQVKIRVFTEHGISYEWMDLKPSGRQIPYFYDTREKALEIRNMCYPEQTEEEVRVIKA